MGCQDMDRLLMKIQINGVKVEETKLDITWDSFSFSYKNYELKFNFRFPVNPKTIKYRSSRILELIIEKETSNAYWPHLLPKAEKKIGTDLWTKTKRKNDKKASLTMTMNMET